MNLRVRVNDCGTSDQESSEHGASGEDSSKGDRGSVCVVPDDELAAAEEKREEEPTFDEFNEDQEEADDYVKFMCQECNVPLEEQVVINDGEEVLPQDELAVIQAV